MSNIVDDFESCYRLSNSRDPRYDGAFFIAATSTRLYCRPSCPSRLPKRSNVRFYPTAAAAQSAGFRACKRCRPDAAPGLPGDWALANAIFGASSPSRLAPARSHSLAPSAPTRPGF
jgi:AraC family transcriptional regulator of adaptative response / DNA-3-methyladenine glycosylase II